MPAKMKIFSYIFIDFAYNIFSLVKISFHETMNIIKIHALNTFDLIYFWSPEYFKRNDNYGKLKLLTTTLHTKDPSIMLGFTLCHISKSHMLTFVQPCLVPCTVEFRGPVRAGGVYFTLVVGVGEPLGEPQLPAGHPSLHIGPPVVTDPTLTAQVGQIYLSCVWSVRGQGNGVICPLEIKIKDT